MEHTHISQIPNLERGLLIAAFTGWNDAASASTWAIKYLIKEWDAQVFADIDGEAFYDFTESRPEVRIVRGAVRQISWPANRFYLLPAHPAAESRHPRNVALFLGEEPHLRWRTYTQEMLDVCRECKIEEIVLLGSLVGEVPHTVPVQISGTASRPATQRRMSASGVELASYSGPTGILTVIHDAARRAGLDASSLWGVAPSYISATPNLAVSEALLRKLDLLYGFHLPLRDLARAAQKFTARVSSLVAEDPDAAAYVRALEQRSASLGWSPAASDEDADAQSADGELPSPEQAIASVEELLRRFREGSGAE